MTCQYDLSNLTSDGEAVHRCPECGRIFDAADPQTYATDSTRFGWPAFLLVLIGALLVLIGVTSPVWIYFLYLWSAGDL